MELRYSINLVGHDEWMESGYSLDRAKGDVITKDGEFIGRWRVAEYDPASDDAGGKYEFFEDGHIIPKFVEGFAFLDFRGSRGLAMTKLLDSIGEWHDKHGI
ncbi:MAG: hypothetical protein EBS68_08700 [Rhodobacteraceae bacterium]|jgi:hypothetical protein|nr:hypothetical protein [Paracoccaceae bacterium]